MRGETTIGGGRSDRRGGEGWERREVMNEQRRGSQKVMEGEQKEWRMERGKYRRKKQEEEAER